MGKFQTAFLFFCAVASTMAAVNPLSTPSESSTEDSPLLIFEFRPKHCKSCAAVENELSKLAAEFDDKISVFKVDKDEENVDNFDDLSSFEDKPTFMFIRNGKKIASYSGFDGEMLRNKIKEIL